MIKSKNRGKQIFKEDIYYEQNYTSHTYRNTCFRCCCNWDDDNIHRYCHDRVKRFDIMKDINNALNTFDKMIDNERKAILLMGILGSISISATIILIAVGTASKKEVHE